MDLKIIFLCLGDDRSMKQTINFENRFHDERRNEQKSWKLFGRTNNWKFWEPHNQVQLVNL